jgi:hypothetical protein
VKNAALGYVSVDAMSKLIFGTSVPVFLTERWDGKASSYSDNSWEITLAELLNNWLSSGMTLVGAKVVDTGLQRLGLYRNFNKFVRSIGMGQLVKA